MRKRIGVWPGAIVGSGSSPQKHVWRARIVLLSGIGAGTMAIQRRTGAKRFWRERTRLAFRISLLAIGLASWFATAASAGTLVEFANLAERGPATLVGYLARPDQGLSMLLGPGAQGPEQNPAVVVLHGCSGLSSHTAEIADRLGAWG